MNNQRKGLIGDPLGEALTVAVAPTDYALEQWKR